MLGKGGLSKFRTTTRCAVYTRQSATSDDDLSSCDVQYEICSAYIRSQRMEGWHLVEERFDDDGFLGQRSTARRSPASETLSKSGK